MILPVNSFIRNPPLILKPEQVVTFNAITYAIDICDISYKRLMENLSRFTDRNELYLLDFPSLILDVNLIIGHALTFKRIIVKEFDIDPDDSKFSEITKGKNIRDSNQHFDERLYNTFVGGSRSVHGYLTWRKLYPGTDRCIIMGARAGAVSENIEMSVSNRNLDSEELDPFIQRLEYTSPVRKGTKSNYTYSEEKVLINRIILQLREWITIFEEELEEQFRDYDVEIRHIPDLLVILGGNKEWK